MKNKARNGILLSLALAVIFVSVLGLLGIVVLRRSGSGDAAVREEPFALFAEGFTDRKIVDQASALAAIRDVGDTLGIGDVNAELAGEAENTISGNTYYRFAQQYQGIPVYGRGMVVVADGGGNGLSLSGNYVPVQGVAVEPSVTHADIEDAVKNYAKQNCGTSECIIGDFDEDALCIFYDDENRDAALAYELLVDVCGVGAYELLVDAEDASVINAQPVFKEDYRLEDGKTTSISAHGQTREQKLDVYEQYGLYITADPARNIELYRMKEASFWVLYSKDTNQVIDIKWPTTKQPEEYAVEIDALANLETAYDYFDEVLKHKGASGKGTSKLYVYTDCAFQSDAVHPFQFNLYDNALGGYIRETDVAGIMIGRTFELEHALSERLDVVAHEYTHTIIGYVCNLAYRNESGAINEGYADIFGELVEKWNTGKCDWVHGRRIIYDPESNGYPAQVQDTSTGIEDFVHGRSTIISHAAYLMNTGVNGKYEALDDTQLAQLFYQTLFTMPSDCTFSQFRSLMENMAKIMAKQGQLTDGQELCVHNVFVRVGIEPAIMPVKRGSLAVDVYDTQGLAYEDYTLYVRRGAGVERPYDSERVRRIGIPMNKIGEYTLRVVDNVNTDNQTTVRVQVVKAGGVTRIPIYTHCGLSPADTPLWIGEERPGQETGAEQPAGEAEEPQETQEPQPEQELERKEVSLLRYDPYEDARHLFQISAYEASGGYNMGEYGYESYAYLPDMPVLATMTDDFDGDGENEKMTLSKKRTEFTGTEYDVLAVEFNGIRGQTYIPEFYIGSSWSGGSEYCYLVHGADRYYLVSEETVPTNTAIGTDTISVGQTDGTRIEDITIYDLKELTRATYTLTYYEKYGAFHIYRNSDEHPHEYLYCQDGGDYKFANNYICDSYEDALRYIRKDMEEYGLESRIAGGESGGSQSAEITPLFVTHQNGLQVEVPLGTVLHDTVYLGVNTQLTKTVQQEEEEKKPAETDSKSISLYGIWNSVDGRWQYRFTPNGEVDGFDLKYGDRDHGVYSIGEYTLTLAGGGERYEVEYLYWDGILTIDDIDFVRLDSTLPEEIVGMWVNDEGTIRFGDSYDVTCSEGKRTGSGLYAVLNESEIIMNMDGYPLQKVKCSVDGNCLNLNGTLFYREGKTN